MKTITQAIKLCLSVLLLLVCSRLEAQFEFSPSTVLTVIQGPNLMSYDSIHIANLSADTLHLDWNRIAYDSSGGNRMDFCASGHCFTGIPLTGNFPDIAPGGFGFAAAHFYTGSFPTTCFAKFYVYQHENLANGDTLTFILNFKSSGIESISAGAASVNIYPDPATTSLTIQTPKSSTLEIINLQGQILKTITNSALNTGIDVSQLPSGIYFIKATTEKGDGGEEIY